MIHVITIGIDRKFKIFKQNIGILKQCKVKENIVPNPIFKEIYNNIFQSSGFNTWIFIFYD